MCNKCDHTSVGILVWHENKILLINRKKYPFGFAPPSGHVDSHGSYEMAAVAELYEETGLNATRLTLLIEGKKNNPCSREGGDWHYWRIYKAIASGQLCFSQDETLGGRWFSRNELLKLASESFPQHSSIGLEEVWYQWFQDLDIIENFDRLITQ